MSGNIKKLYFIFNTFRSTGFIVPILFIFLRDSSGLAVETILLLAGLYTLIPFLIEIPLGIVADRVGNKKIILLGLLFQIASCMALLFADGSLAYQGYLISIYIAGACFSGADRALLNQHITDKNEFKNYLVDINGKMYKYTIGFLLIGSLTYQISPYIPLILQIASFAVSTLALLVISDNKKRSVKKKSHPLKSSLIFLKKDYVYLSIALMAGIYSSAIMVNHKTIQIIFVESLDRFFSMNSFWSLGLLYVAGNLFSYYGNRVYVKLKLVSIALWKQNLIFLSLLVCSFALFSFSSPLLVILGFLTINIFKSIYRPILGAELTTRIPMSSYKATTLSCVALLSAVISSGIHLISSKVFTNLSEGNLYFAIGIIPLVLFLIYISTRENNWSIYLSTKALTGKDNFLSKNQGEFEYIQRYPSNIDVSHFKQLSWAIENTYYCNPVLQVNNLKLTSKYLSGPLLKDLQCDKHEDTLSRFISELSYPTVEFVDEYLSPTVDQTKEMKIPDEILRKICSEKYWSVIHGDLHPENIIVKEHNRLELIDWDLSGRGWVWFDLLTLLSSPYTQISKEFRIRSFNSIVDDLNTDEASKLFQCFLDYKVEQLRTFIEHDESFYDVQQSYMELASDWCRS